MARRPERKRRRVFFTAGKRIAACNSGRQKERWGRSGAAASRIEHSAERRRSKGVGGGGLGDEATRGSKKRLRRRCPRGRRGVGAAGHTHIAAPSLRLSSDRALGAPNQAEGKDWPWAVGNAEISLDRKISSARCLVAAVSLRRSCGGRQHFVHPSSTCEAHCKAPSSNGRGMWSCCFCSPARDAEAAPRPVGEAAPRTEVTGIRAASFLPV